MIHPLLGEIEALMEKKKRRRRDSYKVDKADIKPLLHEFEGKQ